MSITVNFHEAKAQLSRLPAQRRPGRLKGEIDTTRFFDPLPPEELGAWEWR